MTHATPSARPAPPRAGPFTAERPARVALLVSGGGRTLVNLGQRMHAGEIHAEPAVVIASRECLGADRAHRMGMPTLVMPGEITSATLERVLVDHAVDWVLLCGYLKLVHIPRRYEGRVVNIHPALLPEFGGPGMHGSRVHAAVIAAGRTVSGCTVHLCDGAYDTGPIVLQRECPVEPEDTPQSLAARVFEEELIAYPEAIRTLLSNEWTDDARRTIDTRERSGTDA